jgi:hypothetical protein
MPGLPAEPLVCFLACTLSVRAVLNETEGASGAGTPPALLNSR